MTDREHMATLARGFLNALVSRDVDGLATILHPQVDWIVYGPIDMFPFLGMHRGRDAVSDACAELLRATQIGAIKIERQVVAGDSASLLLRCSLRPVRIDTPVSVRMAIFVQLADRLIGDVRVVIDTFDLVQQSLGREINLPVAV